MVSFLGLMDTIKLKPKATQTSRELSMTQYMLKMLTILTNILVSNLIALSVKSPAQDVTAYIGELLACLTQKQCSEIKLRLNSLDQLIPRADKKTAGEGSDQDTVVEMNALSYGCSLLKELAFKFLTYAQDEVADPSLRILLLREYATIIDYQMKSKTLYAQILSKQ